MSGRLYDRAAWKRLRALKLRDAPLCEDCRKAGRYERARVVDHVVPVRLGGDALPALSGLRALCKRCHDQKTARGPEAGAVRTSKPRRGCDAEGQPLDENHPWRAEFERKSLGAEAATPTTPTNLELDHGLGGDDHG